MNLQGAVSAVVNGSGAARVQLGPVPPHQAWMIRRLSVSATAGPITFRLYRGTVPMPAAFVDGTSSGEADTTSDPLPLAPGDVLTGEWTDGTPGTECTLTYEGERVAP